MEKCGKILDDREKLRADPICTALLSEMDYEVGGYNVYNIYDECQLAGDNENEATPGFVEWTFGESGLTDKTVFRFCSDLQIHICCVYEFQAMKHL